MCARSIYFIAKSLHDGMDEKTENTQVLLNMLKLKSPNALRAKFEDGYFYYKKSLRMSNLKRFPRIKSEAAKTDENILKMVHKMNYFGRGCIWGNEGHLDESLKVFLFTEY